MPKLSPKKIEVLPDEVTTSAGLEQTTVSGTHSVNDIPRIRGHFRVLLESLAAAHSRAWLGPLRQPTAQVHVFRPGAKSQIPHCDDRIGFQVKDSCAKTPSIVHAASQSLTIQGAVAHLNMSIRSGPTRLLPFSQNVE